MSIKNLTFLLRSFTAFTEAYMFYDKTEVLAFGSMALAT